MKPVIIIAIAFVLLIPTNVFGFSHENMICIEWLDDGTCISSVSESEFQVGEVERSAQQTKSNIGSLIGILILIIIIVAIMINRVKNSQKNKRRKITNENQRNLELQSHQKKRDDEIEKLKDRIKQLESNETIEELEKKIREGYDKKEEK